MGIQNIVQEMEAFVQQFMQICHNENCWLLFRGGGFSEKGCLYFLYSTLTIGVSETRSRSLFVEMIATTMSTKSGLDRYYKISPLNRGN